ncbi:MAG: hypothetical protein ABWZ88_14980 [Variovorax sp.]
MQPHLQIRCISPQVYAYSLSAGGVPSSHTEPAETTMESLERCLDDAGDSLGHYFASVEISLQGQSLGSYAVRAVQSNANTLACQLREKFSSECLVREAAASAM